MPVYELDGVTPDIAPDAFVAPTASIIGDVVIEAGASVWYGAVIRADFGQVVVRAGANVQDGSVVHGNREFGITEIGEEATVGHACVIHGAVLGPRCLVANGAVVLDGAHVGADAVVAAGSLLPPGSRVGEGMLAVGSPASSVREVRGTPVAELVATTRRAYVELSQRHRDGLRRVDGAEDPEGAALAP